MEVSDVIIHVESLQYFFRLSVAAVWLLCFGRILI